MHPQHSFAPQPNIGFGFPLTFRLLSAQLRPFAVTSRPQAHGKYALLRAKVTVGPKAQAKDMLAHPPAGQKRKQTSLRTHRKKNVTGGPKAQAKAMLAHPPIQVEQPAYGNKNTNNTFAYPPT